MILELIVISLVTGVIVSVPIRVAIDIERSS